VGNQEFGGTLTEDPHNALGMDVDGGKTHLVLGVEGDAGAKEEF
jgi:hypothetical protein